MGTPHQAGEAVTWGILARNLVSIFANTNRETLDHLATNSEWLERQQALFLPISNQFENVYFYETYPTPLPDGGALLVCSSEVLVVGLWNDNLVSDSTETLSMRPRSCECYQDSYPE